jgi:hypothetical protein
MPAKRRPTRWVRDLWHEPALLSWLYAAEPFGDDRLTEIRADLEHRDGWDEDWTPDKMPPLLEGISRAAAKLGSPRPRRPR